MSSPPSPPESVKSTNSSPSLDQSQYTSATVDSPRASRVPMQIVGFPLSPRPLGSPISDPEEENIATLLIKPSINETHLLPRNLSPADESCLARQERRIKTNSQLLDSRTLLGEGWVEEPQLRVVTDNISPQVAKWREEQNKTRHKPVRLSSDDQFQSKSETMAVLKHVRELLNLRTMELEETLRMEIERNKAIDAQVKNLLARLSREYQPQETRKQGSGLGRNSDDDEEE